MQKGKERGGGMKEEGHRRKYGGEWESRRGGSQASSIRQMVASAF